MNRKEQKAFIISKHFIIGLWIFLACCLMLEGCTLARPELQQIEKEELCGILVVAGEQEVQRRQDQELEGRTFTSMRELEKALTASVIVEGTRQTEGTFAFEGVEGHMLGLLEEEAEGHPTTYFINDGFFTKVKANTTVTDTGKEDTISGTILATRELQEPVYMYPVYKRSDGSYYVVLDSAGFLVSGVHEAGEVYGQTLQWETTEEAGGKEEKNVKEIQVSLEVADPVEQVYVYMYNERMKLLEEREIPRGMEKVSLQEETAYVIVEEKKRDGQIQRSLYDWDEKLAEQGNMTHTIYYAENDGLIMPEDLLFDKH